MFPFMNMSFSKVESVNMHLLALSISLPMENRRSTAALEGMAVLYFTKSLMIAGSPKNVAALKSFFELPSNQVTSKLCAFIFNYLADPLLEALGG